MNLYSKSIKGNLKELELQGYEEHLQLTLNHIIYLQLKWTKNKPPDWSKRAQEKSNRSLILAENSNKISCDMSFIIFIVQELKSRIYVNFTGNSWTLQDRTLIFSILWNITYNMISGFI